MTNTNEIQITDVDGQVDEICPNCGAENCYSWNDCNDPKDSEFQPEYDKVYHIPACSGFEWQCGNCGLSFTPIDSPLNCEVYTHNEAE